MHESEELNQVIWELKEAVSGEQKDESETIDFREILQLHPGIKESNKLRNAFVRMTHEYYGKLTNRRIPVYVPFRYEYSICPVCKGSLWQRELIPDDKSDYPMCPYCNQLLDVDVWEN